MIVMGAGILGYTNIPDFWLMLIFAFIGGIGQGGVDISANVITSNLYAEKRTSVLNLLHFFFGFGGLIGPAMVSFSLSTIGIARSVLWVCGALLIFSAGFVYLLRIRLNPVDIQNTGSKTSWKDVYQSPLIWMIGFLLLMHVGVENGLGGWVTTYLQRTTNINIESAALATSIFWGSITIGRLSGIFIGRRFTNMQFLIFSLIGSLIGGILFIITSGNIVPTLISIGVIGFTMGAVYPTVMAVVSLTFPQNPGAAVSLSASLGSVGGMLIPLGQGFILERVSPLASAWYVAIVFLILIFIIWSIARLMKTSINRQVVVRG